MRVKHKGTKFNLKYLVFIRHYAFKIFNFLRAPKQL